MSPIFGEKAFDQVRLKVRQDGLLLLTGAGWPSLASRVAGELIRGSWWSHPRSHAIFWVATRLANQLDVTAVKLISGKVTFVHRRLWPALVAVGSSHDPWQVRGLSRSALALLTRVQRAGRLRTDRLPGYRTGKSKVVAAYVRELELRLLVHSEEFHSETGAHAKWLESWQHWARRVRLQRKKVTPTAARKKLEMVVATLSVRYGVVEHLPWDR